ncbi:restriction endonuclease subunit S [Campylobacter taeniopygiae]|uniref:restriction endonuclease subunit S n=1 Tax=Campylobacter taeniopygiae TaxID=2510188 RepID=UPI003D6BCBEF
MKNFKNSGIEWLGEIPEHWEVVKCKNFFILQNKIIGDLWSKTRLLSLTLNGIVERNINNPEGKFPSDFSTYQVVDKNDLIFCLFDVEETPRTVGLSKINGMITNAYTIFKIKEQEERFLTYFFINLDNGKKLKFLYRGLRKTISKEDLLNLKIPLPPLKEQEQIANFLDEKCEKIQNFIEKKEKLLSLLQEQKQALINETITKGLDKNVKLKNSGIEWLGEIPEHWEVRKLKMLFSFGNGLNITKADFISFGIPCISYGEIHSKYPCHLDLSVHKLPFVSETYLNDKPQSLLSKGDFVFADTSEDIEGSGNFTCIQSNIPLFAGYHTIILRSKTQIYSLSFSFLFDSIFVRNQIREKVWGVKVFSIIKSILKEVQCFIPPLKEQEQIANFLDEKCEKIDSLITKIKKQIELIKEYKTTLINEAICGRMNLNKG